jgi:hypothetical protein
MSESPLDLGVSGEVWREEFECNGAVELKVGGFVDPPATDLLEELVVGDSLADHGNLRGSE